MISFLTGEGVHTECKQGTTIVTNSTATSKEINLRLLLATLATLSQSLVLSYNIPIYITRTTTTPTRHAPIAIINEVQPPQLFDSTD